MFISLNLLRVVLALLVLLYHLGGTIALEKYFGYALFAQVFGFGGARVPFFFALSGFVLTLAYAKHFGQPHRTWPYLRRRFVRLYPTFWVVMSLALLPALWVTTLRDAIPADPWVLFKAYLLLPQEPVVAGPTGAPVIVVAWTLHYEVLFSLLFAVWIYSRRWGLLCSLVLVLNGLACMQLQCGFYGQFLAGSSGLYFAFGVGAASLSPRLPALRHAGTLAWLGTAAYLVVALVAQRGWVDTWPLDPNLFFVLLAVIIMVCLVNAEAAAPEPWGTPRIRQTLQLLSDASYTMYLVHYPLVSLVCKLLVAVGLRGTTGAWAALLLVLGAAIVGSLAFHIVVERPLLARR